MARRSKSSRGSSPNKVLIVFLVLFILAAIGEGVWAYTMIKEKDTWDKGVKDKEVTEAAAKREADWATFKSNELKAAMGDPDFNKSEVKTTWLKEHNDFMEDNRFKYPADRAAFKNFVQTLQQELGWGPNGYQSSYTDRPKAMHSDKLEDVLPKYPAERAAKHEANEKYLSVNNARDKDRNQLQNMIKAGNEKALDVLKGQFKAFDELMKDNEDLRQENAKQFNDHTKEKAKLAKENKDLKDFVKEQEEKAKNPNRALVEPHALVLDVSRGKPLWDTPRGKVVRVEDGGKKVYINKGIKDGVKVGLTFLVFEAGRNGRGEGPLKATIEVVRVDDEHTAQCKVNSYYDIDGKEIAASDATPSKVLRDGNGAMKEGDLLFNTAWGLHVAIVGVVDFTGYDVTNPAAQKQSLDEFMIHLSRMGVIVDAYMDPRDGKMVGEITPRTNIVIRGSTAGGDSKDVRNEAILASLRFMRQEAIDRGMFIISPENFAVITGYRRAGSADNMPTLSFSPRPPSGGAGLLGDTQQIQDQQQQGAKKQ
jgi:hypothetical protein